MVPIVSCCSPSVHKAKSHYSHYNEGPMKEMSPGVDWEVNAAVTLHHTVGEKDRLSSEVCKEDKVSESSEVRLGGSKLPSAPFVTGLSSFVF